MNDRAVSRLDESDAATVAIAALAHGVLALVEEVRTFVAE
jgi:hypothetical protein